MVAALWVGLALVGHRVQHRGRRSARGELVPAEDVGAVRDVLAAAEPEGEPPIHTTVQAAVGAAADRPPVFTSNG